MTENFDNLFEQLLATLQTAERRHRIVYDSASDNSDWSTYDNEGELISNIIKWRRSLESIRSEILASFAISNMDISILPTLSQEEHPPPANENIHMTLLGKEYHVKSWSELFIKVCEVMLLHKPYFVSSLDKNEEFNTENETFFSYVQSDIKENGKRLSNGLWVGTSINNQEIQNMCRRLLEKVGFSSDDLKII